jgi:hypothetical protein
MQPRAAREKWAKKKKVKDASKEKVWRFREADVVAYKKRMEKLKGKEA